jgi:meso-butanediol dehydrogenase/(S,S)-butanediol dehydrogenase/diacetyl reductase
MAERFEDKVVIVTGAASGIGEASARRFSAEGAKVVLVDRQGEALEKVAAELPSDRTLVHVADVSDRRRQASALKRFGRLDVLVNNAGVHEGGNPAEITDEQWRKVMATDADGVFFGCRPAPPRGNSASGDVGDARLIRKLATSRDYLSAFEPRLIRERVFEEEA